MSCVHTDGLADLAAPAKAQACPACLAMAFTGWVHLRMCLSCGAVGCCDSSPNRHASAHAERESHPVMRSIEPGEDWRWCYLDEQLV
ncbi:MAG: UBP-type zinc finger domain-containing protein [Sciscionella sp.]